MRSIPDIPGEKCMVIWQIHGNTFLHSKYHHNIRTLYCTHRLFGTLWPKIKEAKIKIEFHKQSVHRRWIFLPLITPFSSMNTSSFEEKWSLSLLLKVSCYDAKSPKDKYRYFHHSQEKKGNEIRREVKKFHQCRF